MCEIDALQEFSGIYAIKNSIRYISSNNMPIFLKKIKGFILLGPGAFVGFI